VQKWWKYLHWSRAGYNDTYICDCILQSENTVRHIGIELIIEDGD